MGELRELNEKYKKYTKQGNEAYYAKDVDKAIFNYLKAAEALYKIAKLSAPDVKKEKIETADKLVELAEKLKKLKNNSINKSIENKSTNKSDDKITSSAKITYNDGSTLEESLRELKNLIGLKEVKDDIEKEISFVNIQKAKKEHDFKTKPILSHYVFLGNPGTGKTTVARILSKIFYSLGLLSKGHLVEVTREDLVAGYQGQSAIKTKDALNKALGGVLFVDEAYSLVNDERDVFGIESLNTITKFMDDNRDQIIVIFAGYEEDIKKLISRNIGLESRFTKYIHFEDFTSEELFKIYMSMQDKKVKLTDEAITYLKSIINNKETLSLNGNARFIRKLHDQVEKEQSYRIDNLRKVIDENTFKNQLVQLLSEITIDDIKNAAITTLKTKLDNRFHITSKNKNLNMKNKNNEERNISVDEKFLEEHTSSELRFNWDSLPVINFDDIAGLKEVKEVVRTKVLLPLEAPDAFEGYSKKNGGGLFLYGPPGTGKTMIAAAIANEIGAKFCSVKPSDLLNQGAGNTEKAVRQLFLEARQFPCAVIYFDEMDSIAQKSTKSSYSRQLRSELLAQMQGVEAYGNESGNILFLISATNKPWEVDSAFLRPGRFGTKVFVGLPDYDARKYIINSRINKIRNMGIVKLNSDIDIDDYAKQCEGYNGSDITNLIDRVEEISALRGHETGNKYISNEDFEVAFEEIHSSVQVDDIEKLINWKNINDN